jgi:hypothetical protein
MCLPYVGLFGDVGIALCFTMLALLFLRVIIWLPTGFSYSLSYFQRISGNLWLVDAAVRLIEYLQPG